MFSGRAASVCREMLRKLGPAREPFAVQRIEGMRDIGRLGIKLEDIVETAFADAVDQGQENVTGLAQSAHFRHILTPRSSPRYLFRKEAAMIVLMSHVAGATRKAF